MTQYIFAHDTRDNSFPERIRVVSSEEDAASLREQEKLTATVLNTKAIALLDDLTARHETDESLVVEFVDAPSWEFIEQRFRLTKVEK